MFAQILRQACVLLVGAGLISLAACKSYQLGHPTELPFETIYVQAATNDSYAPQAQALISSEIREAIIRDGRVKLVAGQNDADVILYVNLTDYKRQAGTRDQDDTEVAQDYAITLEAEIALYDPRNDTYLFKSRTVGEHTTAYAGNPYADSGVLQTGGLIQSEYQAMTRIARGMGRKIADETLSAW
ncbi:MAG: LPS assembly lipoprotein LptE [Opitutales bacterium]